ncbi:UNVERIFIED_CONTAM: hypothetical protein IGO34_22720 [Salmonella enterica subsp. enterica serovar Weltevreden]
MKTNAQKAAKMIEKALKSRVEVPEGTILAWEFHAEGEIYPVVAIFALGLWRVASPLTTGGTVTERLLNTLDRPNVYDVRVASEFEGVAKS